MTLPFPEDIQNVSEIYHLACPASPKHFAKNPIEILQTCYQGTKNVLDFAVKCKARVLLTSTSGKSPTPIHPNINQCGQKSFPMTDPMEEVYGDPLVCPQSESYYGNVNSFGPRSCYDEGKRVAEAMAYAYRLEKNIDVRIARIFNAYGPGMRPDDGRVVPNFISAAIEHRDMEISGDGTAIRCFQYVGDCVLGLYKLMQSSCTTPVNIGCDKETSIADLACLVSDIVARKTGSPSAKVRFTDGLDDDPVRRRPDISLAKRELKWYPDVSLEQGLEMTVDWFLKSDLVKPTTN